MKFEAARQWLQSVWYGNAKPPLALRAVAGLYEAVVRLRCALYRRGVLKSQHLRVPVIVIGNLTVGGAGKTPVVIALAEYLAAQGFAPGVVSRGYGRQSQGLRVVAHGSTADEVGDEPLLIAQRTRRPVIVAEDRVAAARALVESYRCNMVIADDGLQHYRLARDIEILVIDGRRRFGNGYSLPAGPLREPAERAARCDFQLISGGEARAGEIPVRLAVRQARPLIGYGPAVPLAAFGGRAVHAVAGIGDPGRFFSALQAQGLEVIPHPFPDHHAFRAEDVAFGDGRAVLMTEKDAVKCIRFNLPHAFAVPLEIELPAAWLDELARGLQRLHPSLLP